jgi:hypothetical protein
MVLAGLTILIMLLVAAVFTFEGLFSAFVMCINILLAGLVACNCFEPIAAALEPHLAGTRALGYEDALSLIFLFWVTLGVLRLATGFLAGTVVSFHPLIQRTGGAVFGLGAGYLAAGFLMVAFQTLPCHENFLGFEPRIHEPRGWRRYLPPDRVWLASMHRAGAGPFSNGPSTFDPDGTFTLRYARYRRHGDDRDPLPDKGELKAPAPTKSGR